MPALILTTLSLSVLYAALMLCYRYGWSRLQSTAVRTEDQSGISIIIPARNEAKNIGACLGSIMAQDYPAAQYEIIVIDDDSEDDTVAIVSGFENVKLIRLNQEGVGNFVAHKKRALNAGIVESRFEIIVTTDADCMAAPGWLKSIGGAFQQSNAVMVAGPVRYTQSKSLLSVFQSLDFMTMQGITAATLELKWGSMANGANLSFRKEAFQEVKGYEGIDHLASGDDMLLMNKLRQHYKDQIIYLKDQEAIITTSPQASWKDFLDQRIRWASKSGKYDDKGTTVILSLVYLFNLSLLLFCLFMWCQWEKILGILAVKIIAEMILLWPVAGFFKKRNELFWFPFLQPMHILYVAVAGLLGMIGSYSWKGRRVR